MNERKLVIVKTTKKARSHKFLEGIKISAITGSELSDKGVVILGCVNEDRIRFYEGLFRMEQEEPVLGIESVEEMKEWWEDGGDGCFLCLEEGEFELVEVEE